VVIDRRLEMFFDFTPEQKAFQEEVREFALSALTPEVIEELRDQGEVLNAHSPTIYKQLAKRGWLGLQWPKEYGGGGASFIEMAIFMEEMGYAGIPMIGYQLSVNQVGNTILAIGTEEQKKEYLPRLLSGESLFCVGFTEPNAGSDLAAVECNAEQEGDEFVISGQKIFTTNAHVSDYIILATRTDKNVPKHKGITMFIVPMDSEGVSVRPIWTLGGGRVNETFFEDVRVPRKNAVGDVNRGWHYITTHLDYERSGTYSVGLARKALDQIIDYVKASGRKGNGIAKDPLVRQKLSRLETELEVARLLAYRVSSMQSKGLIPNTESSMTKLYTTELVQRIAHAGLQIMDLYGLLNRNSQRAPIGGYIESLFRGSVMYTIAAGSSEIQKLIIAGRGLGLVR
jgi:alkylation response protein AidB-like acyl-CoA dehydrogenase